VSDIAKNGDRHLKAVQRLADVLELENVALKRLDFPAAVALVPAKEAALADLTNPSAPTIQRTALAQRLAGLASENHVLLERAIAVQTRVVRIVARAATPPPTAIRYNGYGGRTPAGRTGALALSTRA
jgi:hypothetical protein